MSWLDEQRVVVVEKFIRKACIVIALSEHFGIDLKLSKNLSRLGVKLWTFLEKRPTAEFRLQQLLKMCFES